MIKKIGVILLLGLFISSVGLASTEYNRGAIIHDFSEGLNSHINEYNIPKNQAVVALNVRTNKVFSSISKRDTMLTLLDFGTGPINGVHRYYESDGTSLTVAALGTTLAVDNSGTALVIKDSLTDGKTFQFVTYKDVEIMGNGYDPVYKYDGSVNVTANTDGHRTATELCTELGAPFAELNTGANLDAAKWYQYRMAWYDGSTYDYSEARSNPILTGATVRDITLTDIPIGPTGTTARYVYRTLGNSSQANCEADDTFYLVGTLSDNTTTTLNDTVTDDTADDGAAPTLATVENGTEVTPPLGTLYTVSAERLFISGNLTYLSDLYWSDDGNPDHFLPTDFEQIRVDDGDKITFVKPFRGILTIGKTNSIQNFYTDGKAVSDWYYSDPFSFVGCIAKYSAAVTPIGTIYLARNGLYRFDGQTCHLVSDAVTPEIEDISQIDLDNVSGFYFKSEYQMAYTSESSGSTTNNRVLIFDIVRNSYVVDTKEISCFTAFNAGTDSGVLYSGSSTTDGYVVAHEGSIPSLIIRYKSEFNDGTFDDSRVYNTESKPIVDIGWDCTIDGWLTELQTKDASITTINSIETYLPNAIIDRPDTGGTWTSPVYYINASSLDKLYWNEDLGPYGDITFQIRLGASAAACVSASWSSSYTNPSGSDISGVTANTYIQFKVTLSTTDIDYTPSLYQTNGYVFRIFYSQVGVDYETSVLSKWESGWRDLGYPLREKMITRIKVYYTGTSGTITLNCKNDVGDVDSDITIDLAVDPASDSEDEYTGVNKRIFTYLPPENSETEPSLIGQFFKFTITEEGIGEWDIDRIEFRLDVEEMD